MKFSKRSKIICIGLVICITTIAILTLTRTQVVTNPAVTAEINVPSDVKMILERACYNCHSNKTRLEWFDKLPIVSKVVDRDVEEARRHFNFSQWNDLSPVDQKGKIWEIYNMVKAGKMPLKSYVDFHPESRITPGDLAVLKAYATTLSVSNRLDTIGRNFSIQRSSSIIPISANGIKHMPEYRNWEIMSTTSRFDNGSMRVMFANPIAMRAVREKQINPWPNGAVIAKVVWEKLEDKAGNIRQGKLVNIQYMVRDEAKYKETGGWGFARFDTKELKPYGKLATFKKCIACHQAVKDTGFVFDLSTVNNL